MADKTTKEYQDKQTKKALKQRDANRKKNTQERDKFMKDAVKDTYDTVYEATKKLKTYYKD